MVPLLSVALGIGIAAAASSATKSFSDGLVRLREGRARLCRAILVHRGAIDTAYAAGETGESVEALRAELIRGSEELTEIALRFPRARLSFVTGEPDRYALLEVAGDLAAFASRRRPVAAADAWVEIEDILRRAGARDFVDVLRRAREGGDVAG